MGSPKVSNAKPQLPMDSKTNKSPLLSSIKNLFKNKKNEKGKFAKEITEKPKTKVTEAVQNEKIDAVAHILKGIENLALKQEESKKQDVTIRKNSGTDEEVLTHFNFKVIEDDRKRHSSEDSGFSESKDDQEVIESFHKLTVEDGEHEASKKEDEDKKEEKERKLQLVLTSRAPIRSNVSNYNVDPYHARQVRSFFQHFISHFIAQ